MMACHEPLTLILVQAYSRLHAQIDLLQQNMYDPLDLCRSNYNPTTHGRIGE